jgi:ABC-type multidrug transport system ATPase subunit
MSEELLKAIIQLFAIVSKERITEDERLKIKEFLSLHLNQEAIRYYLTLFDEFGKTATKKNSSVLVETIDDETVQFIDDWAQIMQITKKVNQALTKQQKSVLVIKIIELCYADGELSERQSNLVFYISEALNIPQGDTQSMRAFVMGQDVEELAFKNILVIDEGSDVINHPGPRIQSKNLTGLIAILRLHNMETYFIKYLGISNVYLNNSALKSRKIDVFPTGSTIKGNKIDTIYYSDVVGKFLVEEQEEEICLKADHIFYHFKSGRAGLQNINIAENGGKLIGLMGASGSGKSTLLNVLNGSEKPSSGSVTINGIDIYDHPEKVRGVIGYIPQDDLLIEDLTVYQNLFFAAQLCYGNYSKEKLHTLVEKVLRNLGLSETRDLKVGGVMDKVISGGQRKRLNIGLELLREPTVLFVDEPTSGLSSRDSENIMDLLKELTLKGKMVYVVIHQPSSDIFKLFDTLIILDVGGFQIYYGNPVEAVNYFQDIISAANKTPGACPECGNVNPEQIFNIIETRVVNEYGQFTHTRKVSPGQWYQYFKKHLTIPKATNTEAPLVTTQKIPSGLKQFIVFAKRDILSKLSNKQYMVINALLSPVLSLFMSYFVRYFKVIGESNPAYSFYDNRNIPVYFFMSVVVALFIGLVVSAEEIFRDRRILKREKYLQLSRFSYLSSKVGVLFLISAIQTVCFMLVGNVILELPATEVQYWIILFSASCFANMLGLNISSSFDSAVTIYIIIPILVIPQLLLSGVVITFDKFNPKVGNPTGIPIVAETMTSRWAFEAFVVSQFMSNPYSEKFYDVDQRIHNAAYMKQYYLPSLETSLSMLFNNRSKWRDKNDEEIVEAFALLKNELGHQASIYGRKQSFIDRIEVGKFNDSTYNQVKHFLEALRRIEVKRGSEASRERDSLVNSLAESPSGENAATLSRKYQNSEIINLAENALDPQKIVPWKGALVRRFAPIYENDFRPQSPVDFRGAMYSPKKHFMGSYFDTFSFNITIIWIFTIMLFITLYFDLLKNAVQGFELRRKYSRKAKLIG